MKKDIVASSNYSEPCESFQTVSATESFITSENHFPLKQQLIDAITYDEFELFYQPQTEVSNNKVIGVEALLRWHSPEFGMIYPANFIPAAESFGLISELGNLVIEKACVQASVWKKKYANNIRIAINVSYLQVQNNNVVELVDRSLSKHDIEPCRLEIELTESSLVKDVTKVVSVLNQFKEMGVRTAIDDFGTGYSSLSNLARMPFDMIKIDRSFINMLGLNVATTTITEAIIQLSKSLHMEVLAEGVETKNQLNILSTNQCDYMQGNLICRAVSAEMLPCFVTM